MKRSLSFNQKGFTLIEIIVCLILLGVIGTGLAIYFAHAVEGFLLTKATNEACQKANLALERVTREIKNMDSISSAGLNFICFSRDNTNFCLINKRGETTIKMDRGITDEASASNILIDNVENFTITLLDGENGTWDPAASGGTLSGLSRVTICLGLQIFANRTRTFNIDINPLYNSTVNSGT